MSIKIIDRGRGPEIDGTRITVYHVMDYIRAGAPLEQAADDLGISLDQAKAAAEYINEHREAVSAEYDRILDRVRRGNPPWVKALLAKDAAELKRRIEQRAALAAATPSVSSP
jgi:uncharacterized protein (DUF433 family)